MILYVAMEVEVYGCALIDKFIRSTRPKGTVTIRVVTLNVYC